MAAGHPATATVGRDILSGGGSAADAVAAMILAGCVAETLFTGLAGGGFATVYDARSGTVECLDFFVAVPGLDGTVPEPPTEISVSFEGVRVPYAVGGPTVAVPGTVPGVARLHARHGRLPWAEIVGPARELAHAGVPFPSEHAKLLPDVAAAMILGDGVRVYSRPDGAGGRRSLAEGELLHHEGLAATLDELLDAGPDALTTGRVGRELVRAVRAAGGALSDQDMSAYRVRALPVRRVRFAGATVCVRDNDLDNFAATAAELDAGLSGADAVQRARLLVRALRGPAGRGETTSVAAADADGNACAATHSLGLGSGVWVAGLHGNSMLGEGELLRGDLRPGERMPSMMVPLVVLDDDGSAVLAGGAAGGSRIRAALLQVLEAILADRHPAAEAVAAPRIAVTDDAVHVEPGLPHEVIVGLRADRERVVEWPALRSFFGGVAVVTADGPAADPRRGGLALRVEP